MTLVVLFVFLPRFAPLFTLAYSPFVFHKAEVILQAEKLSTDVNWKDLHKLAFENEDRDKLIQSVCEKINVNDVGHIERLHRLLQNSGANRLVREPIALKDYTQNKLTNIYCRIFSDDQTDSLELVRAFLLDGILRFNRLDPSFYRYLNKDRNRKVMTTVSLNAHRYHRDNIMRSLNVVYFMKDQRVELADMAKRVVYTHIDDSVILYAIIIRIFCFDTVQFESTLAFILKESKSPLILKEAIEKCAHFPRLPEQTENIILSLTNHKDLELAECARRYFEDRSSFRMGLTRSVIPFAESYPLPDVIE